MVIGIAELFNIPVYWNNGAIVKFYDEEDDLPELINYYVNKKLVFQIWFKYDRLGRVIRFGNRNLEKREGND
jgi:hypothetical protein